MSFGLDAATPPPHSPLQAILDEFADRWERGEAPRSEEYLDRLGPATGTDDVVELIYQEYCLAESSGLEPDPAEFLRRFPAQSDSLNRLFGLHDAFTSSQLRDWARSSSPLPEVGDEIGPYLLRREVGRGGFARVFLAEQADLDNRPVVVKVSTRITPEAQLLARARHSYIVEVLSHATIEGGALQLISMPFLGGATLAAVLEERRRIGGRPRSGREFLKDLDRVSASEYPSTGQARPSRDLIAGLSYPKAVGWIIARLAEALDFAYARGVAHGDIKPSNILITADGVPMLLDFNLAVGWRFPSRNALPEDAGGTLAYMAPERLAAVAEQGPPAVPRAADRHRADLYALGVVLVETLTGRTPDLAAVRGQSAQQLAAQYAESRRRPREVAAWASHPVIDPALRSIVARCLAPDPADRYGRAAELAEDLDRWRADQQLAFAPEPPLQFRLARWGRRRRWALGAAVLMVALVATAAIGVAHQHAARDRALANLAHYWDRNESGAFGFVRVNRWRTTGRGDPAEIARGHLAHFEADGTRNWRERDDVRDLPDPVRDELELWILEQVLRFAWAVEPRADSPDDRRLALALLEREAAATGLTPIAAARRRLQRRLGLSESAAEAVPAPNGPGAVDPRRNWMEEYLRGIEDELALRPSEGELAHFKSALAARPDSFWAHYRAAAVAYRLGRYDEAAEHLERCIALRSNNPALRVQLAGSLIFLGRYDEALRACDKAIALDPNQADNYYERSLIRRRMGQNDASAADLRRFEDLARRQGKAPRGVMRLFLMGARQEQEGPDPDAGADDLPRRLLDIDPDDVDARVELALRLEKANKIDEAVTELSRILLLNPDHLWARYTRAVLLARKRDKRVVSELTRVVEHSRFEEFLAEFPLAINTFHILSWYALSANDIPKARTAAENGLHFAEMFHAMQGESHYALARVYATEAKTDPSRRDKVRSEIRTALALNPGYVLPYLERDPVMGPFRAEFLPAAPPTATNSQSPGSR